MAVWAPLESPGLDGLPHEGQWLSRAFASRRPLPFFMISVLLAILLIFTQAANCREKGWVPLEQSSKMAREILPGISTKSAQTPVPAKRRTKKTDDDKPVEAVAKGSTVYEGQPVVREGELSTFLELLPRFRAWCGTHGEDAHPVINVEGKPDFKYSPAAAAWVKEQGFEPARFFCVMGRMAAALAIVEEGNDYAGSRPKDMPSVDPKELSLARKHLGELLSAGGAPGPIR